MDTGADAPAAVGSYAFSVAERAAGINPYGAEHVELRKAEW